MIKMNGELPQSEPACIRGRDISGLQFLLTMKHYGNITRRN